MESSRWVICVTKKNKAAKPSSTNNPVLTSTVRVERIRIPQLTSTARARSQHDRGKHVVQDQGQHGGNDNGASRSATHAFSRRRSRVAFVNGNQTAGNPEDASLDYAFDNVVNPDASAHLRPECRRVDAKLLHTNELHAIDT